MWEKPLCRHQAQWRRRGRRWSRRWSRDSPAVNGEDHGEAGCAPAAHGGPRWNRYSFAAYGGPHARAGGCRKAAVTPWRLHSGVGSWQDLWPCGERGAHAGEDFLAGLVTLWGTHSGAAFSWRTAPHRKDLHWRSSWRTAAHGKDSHWRSSWGGLSPVGETPCWSKGRMWGGRSSRDNVWWTDHNPIPHPFVPPRRRS